MFTVKRNQIVICALVAMIGVAGYLNYVDTGINDTQMVLSDNMELTPLFSDNADGSATASEMYEESSDEVVSGEESTDDFASNDDPTISVSDAADSMDNAVVANEKPGDAVFVNGTTDTSYFVQAKLDREQVRAKEKDMLMEMVNSSATPEKQKSEAAEEVLELQKRIEKENAAEAMIESKGFNGVYVRIDDDTVDVVVNKPELTDQEIAQIQDIVSRKTGLTADKIRINTLKTK